MQPGTQLGSYEILELLGKGGMGEVYRARDPHLERDVAIKLLPASAADEGDHLARLKREARALAALNHPNIATIHDLEEEDGTQFIVMELIEGTDLAQRMRDRPLTTSEALDIAGQVARALEAAHQSGLVHRDLKPENITLAADGHVKVLDFGIAKRLSEAPIEAVDESTDTVMPTHTALTAAGTVMGTPAYMSPEQIRAQPVDPRTDVWAFGCVLFEMLSGTRAFGRETVADTMTAVLSDEPDEGSLPDDVPDAVRQLIRGALIKDREHRLSSLHDARVSLEHSSSGAVAASPASLRAGDSSARGLLAVAGVVLFAVAGWYAWTASAPGTVDDLGDRTIAVLPFETLGEAEPTAFTEGVHVDMLTRLSRIPELRVTSRTSVMQYRAPDRPLPEIASELGVTWVLLAEVQESGNQVQVNARLVNAVADDQVWAQTYRRELTAENLFDIQAELTERISEELQAQLSPQQLEATSAAPTRNLEAYRLYVQGRELLSRRTPQDMRDAIGFFEQAVALDAEYALAWVGIADTHALLESYRLAPDEDLITPGFEAANRALELNPEIGEAHASRGLLIGASGGVVAEGFAELRRAVELRPSYAEAYNWMAWGLLVEGRSDLALENAQRAAALDPLSVEALSNVVMAEVAVGNYEGAIEQAPAVMRLETNFETTGFYEALARLHTGDYEAASAFFEGPPIPWAGQGRLTGLAVARARLGDTEAAEEALTVLQETGHAIDVAIVSSALGRPEAAWDALENTEEWDQWPRIAAFYLFPDLLEPFRADPRWEEIVPAPVELDEAR